MAKNGNLQILCSECNIKKSNDETNDAKGKYTATIHCTEIM